MKILANTASRPVRRGVEIESACMPSAALPVPVAAVPAAAVATVYSEPAKLVTTPAPLVASVIAWPPAEVMIVSASPATAVNEGQLMIKPSQEGCTNLSRSSQRLQPAMSHQTKQTQL